VRFLVIGLLVLAVLAAGCIGGQQAETAATTSTSMKPIQEPATSTTTPLTATSTTIAADEEITPTLPIFSNVSGCMALGNATIKDLCLYDIAGRDKNIKVCDSITDGNTMLKCKAHLEDKPEYCDQIDLLTDKDWCFRMMAFKWNKLDYCNAIFTQSLKDKCVLDFVKDKKPDPYMCFQILDNDMRDACILYHIDLYNKTGAGIKPTLCGLIYNITVEMKCNETYLHQKF